MNKKFLPGAVLFIITFVLGSLAGRTEIYAVDPTDTFYGTQAGNGSTTAPTCSTPSLCDRGGVC